MGSRHLQGTIFRRVKTLLATGAIREKPVWFDVMAAFPPLVEAKLTDVPEERRPPVMRFKEDDIRDIFIERFPLLKKLPVDLLTKADGSITYSDDKINKEKGNFQKGFTGLPSLDTLVEKYKEYAVMSNDFEAAINRTVEWVLSEMENAKMKSLWAKQVKDLKKQEKGLAQVNEDEEAISDSIDITDLFKLSTPPSNKRN